MSLAVKVAVVSLLVGLVMISELYTSLLRHLIGLRIETFGLGWIAVAFLLVAIGGGICRGHFDSVS